MTDQQKKAYEWAKNQNYGSVAATYAKELAVAIDDLQRQLDAAVRDILCSDHCDVCKHSRVGVEDCETYDFDCEICKSTKCACRDCRDEHKWEWRGVTE